MHKAKVIWNAMRASFWFLPYLIVILSALLAVALTHFDESALEQWMKDYPRLFGASAAGARGMLSTIAASMISVVGIVFSMTLVALALASSQYSSRVLRSFMRSRLTQVAIGMFAGIFVYCLIVLRGVHGQDDTVFVPVLAVTVAGLLALLGVAMLIYFIHHIALSIQASTVLAHIAHETMGAIDELFPEDACAAAPERDPDAAHAAFAARARWESVPAAASGYLQYVDREALTRFACESGLIVRMACGVGHFVQAGTAVFAVTRDTPGARAAPKAFPDPSPDDGRLATALHGAIALSAYRTVEQDPAFGIRQLVDVALKALSPGVNDTTTAVMCLDYLGAILAALSCRAIGSPYRLVDGMLKAIVPTQDFAGLLEDCFDQIRRSAAANVTVIVHMIAIIGMLEKRTRLAERRAQLLEQLGFIAELSERTIPAAHDRHAVLNSLAPLRRALAEAPAQERDLAGGG